MPLRQVRLDDDVADLVAAFQDAEGLKSLSSSANRMLRLAAAETQQEPTTHLGDISDGVVAFSLRPRRLGGRPASAQVATPPPASGPCSHPALARRGNLCGRCGATL